MRVLVLFAHPVETSFNAALHRLIVDRLAARGHEVDDCDLYAEGFDPVMSRDGRMRYHTVGANIVGLEEHARRLAAAEALVLCFPVWNYGFPAILKGYFDRLFVPGVSFDLDGGAITPRLGHIRKMMAVTSYGGSRLRAVVMGDPPRRIVMRWLRANIRLGGPAHYLAHYSMNTATDTSRTRFMAKVAARLEAF